MGAANIIGYILISLVYGILQHRNGSPDAVSFADASPLSIPESNALPISKESVRDDQKLSSKEKLITERTSHLIDSGQEEDLGERNPNGAVLKVVLTFPKKKRKSRSADESSLDLLARDSLEIIERTISGITQLIDLGEPVLLETPDGYPYTSTTLLIQDVISMEDLSDSIKQKLQETAARLNYLIESISTIVGRKLGETCSSSSNCIDDGNVCIDKVCKCSNTHQLIDGACVSDGSIGSSCKSKHDCNTNHTMCLDSFCVCEYHYHPEGTNCIKDDFLGKTCDDIRQCNPFSMECSTGRCRCKEIFVEHNGLCLLKTNYGENCSVSQQCPPSQVCNSDNVCECNEGTHFFSTVGCSTVKNYGSACLVKEECFGAGMACTNFICQCEEDLALSSLEDNKCIRAVVSETYLMVFNDQYIEALYGDSSSAIYQLKAALVEQIFITANIPEFVSVEEVILRESNNNKLEALVTFSLNNPDTINNTNQLMKKRAASISFPADPQWLKQMRKMRVSKKMQGNQKYGVDYDGVPIISDEYISDAINILKMLNNDEKRIKKKSVS